MNIPYSNKKHFNNSYHHPQQQQQDENLLGMSYQASNVHPMNFNNSFKQFKNEQQYGTPVSDSGSNFASSFSSNTSSSFSSASSLALSNLGSSFSSSALSTSTIGSPPNFYYGSSPNPQPTNINGSLNNNSYSKTNLFTPTITSSNTNNENNLNINSFSTPKSGASQTRPIVHSRPMSWDDVGEYARQSYSTSSSSNSGGLFMNELSSSMDDLTLASSPGLFGGSQFGSSLSTSYANSFNEAKIDNITSSNPIDNMFVRSVVDKVLSDENNQDDESEQLHSSFKPRPTSQFHNRATSMDRYLHPQQAFKNTATPVNRRTLSQSCPTGMAQMNGVGYQLFQQQQQQNQQKAISPNNIQQDDSAQPCRFYYSPEGCPAGENCPFMHSNTAMIASQNSQTRVHPQQQQPQVSKPKSRYQNDTFTVINFGSSSIPHSPSLSQQTPPSNGVLPIVNDNSANANISNSNNSNQATPQVCQFFKKGECKFGDKCRNVHLKNKSKIDEQSRKKLKSIRCRFGVNCPFGHECYYYHTDSDFEDTPSNGNNEEQ